MAVCVLLLDLNHKQPVVGSASKNPAYLDFCLGRLSICSSQLLSLEQGPPQPNCLIGERGSVQVGEAFWLFPGQRIECRVCRSPGLQIPRSNIPPSCLDLRANEADLHFSTGETTRASHSHGNWRL
jgi:hypothetical protein